jgi:ribosomal protein L7/L12
VPVGCADGAAHIVMLHPPINTVPEKKAAVTPSGKPTIHTRPKTERNELYAQAMASNILATVREGFAVAPALRRILIVTVSRDSAIGGIPHVSALAATGFDRDLVEQFNWNALDPWRTLEAASPRLLNVRGRTSEIAPLDLSGQPDIALVVHMVAEALNRKDEDRDSNTWAVELGGPPRQKIPVIKALREEFGYALREAKELVDSGGVVATGLSHDHAEQVARTLTSLGAEAEVISR